MRGFEDGKRVSVLIVSAFDPLEGEGRELIRYPVLARALVDQGAKVTYISSSFEHFSKTYRTADFLDLPYQVQLISTPAYSRNIGFRRLWNHYIFGKNLVKFLSTSDTSYDVIISAFPPIFANALLSKWANKKKIPFLIDVQDLWPEAFAAKLPAFLGKSIFYSLLRQREKALNQADSIISVSQDYIEKLKIEPARSAVFPLGANFENPSFPQKQTDEIALILLAGSDSLPFLPTLIRQIEAFPQHVKLMLVGRSGAFLSIKSTDRISVFYDVDEKQKDELLKQADVGLVLNDPGLVSRMPNKVFSYLSYGLSIISNLEGGELENLLKEENWGFTCSSDLSDFSDALEKLLKGELYFDKNRIYNQAKSIFDKKNIYERYARYVLEQIK